MTENEREELHLKDGAPELASEPGTKPQGDVMIEIPFDQNWNGEMTDLVQSLESKGWKVSTKVFFDPSFEDNTSDGVATGRPVSGTLEGANNIIDGVSMPKIDEKSVYKVVQIVRPEDTVPGGDSKLLYLMNGNGDVKEYMKNEGYLVVDDADGLHTALINHPEKTP